MSPYLRTTTNVRFLVIITLVCALAFAPSVVSAQSIELDPSSNQTIYESSPGLPANITVTLSESPTTTATTTITQTSGSASSSDYSIFEASGTKDDNTILLDSGNWDSGVTITISVVDDDLVETTEFINLTYNDQSGVYANATSTTNVFDNDSAGVNVAESNGSTDVSEDGSDDQYQLDLNSEPTSDVDINLSTDSQVTVGVSTLTFTPSNWDTTQSVTVSAVDDSAVEQDTHTGKVEFSVSSSDSDYDNLSTQSFAPNVADNDSNSNSSSGGGGRALAPRANSGSQNQQTVSTRQDPEPTTETPPENDSVSETQSEPDQTVDVDVAEGNVTQQQVNKLRQQAIDLITQLIQQLQSQL